MLDSSFSRKRRKPSFDIRLPTSFHDEFLGDFTTTLEASLLSLVGQPFDCPLSFKINYLRQNLLSKFSDLSTTSPSDRRTLAIEKWLRMEKRNADTNHRLLFDSCTFKKGITSDKILRFARKIVSQTIGDSPPENILDGQFTNGASTRVKRGPTAIAQKYVGEANVTREAWPLFKTRVLPSAPLWNLLNSDFENCQFVEGNVLFTVPKNSEIDRVACKEPELNMFMQRGIGNYFRDALKRKCGIDLNDQSKNRNLARLGSIDGSLATLDLSSASDLISLTLVNQILPIDWFLLLDSVRSKHTIIDGVKFELNMFSSMGNGFTFELETLVFYALCVSVNYHLGVRGRISVYGDDIITPVGSAGMIAKVFSWFGFIVNPKKSYWTGNFRESCGGHYYRGCDVSPFFLRERVGSYPVLIRFLNQFRAWACDEAQNSYHFPQFHRFWKKWSDRVPHSLYGGRDVEESTSLVTPDRPRKRISPISRPIYSNPTGAYLHWMHRSEEIFDLETSYASYEVGYTQSRNRTWELVLPQCQLWWEEFLAIYCEGSSTECSYSVR